MRQIAISDGLWRDLKTQSQETGIAIGELVKLHRRPARVRDVVGEYLTIVAALLYAVPGSGETVKILDQARADIMKAMKDAQEKEAQVLEKVA